MSERLEKLKDQLLAAVEGTNSEDVATDLDQELQTLIKAAKSTPPNFLESAWSFNDDVKSPPTSIGPFEIVDVLGRGGMGVVYRARQVKPIVREVALKVVRSELISKSAISRFELERSVLAKLNHNNIAKILETGTSERRYPYIAMELVDGPTVSEYVKDRQPPLNQRLELFLSICQGIAHAHARGVIHRDLKPSNILVVEEEKSIPKIIDFGIAKLIDAGLNERLTLTDQVLGTLEYVGPEVIESGAMAADVRSDVYALGAILYELITGVPPICLNDVRDQGIMTVLKAAQQSSIVNPLDQIELSDRSHGIRKNEIGDLNCITMHALARDPDGRYQSVTEMAADIRRFLDNKTILAAPPSQIKSVLKFARRNWITIATTATIFISLAAGFGISYANYLKSEQSRLLAQKAQREAEDTIALIRDAALSANVRDHAAKAWLANLGEKIEALLEKSELVSPKTQFELKIMLEHAYTAIGKTDKAGELLESIAKLTELDWATANEKFLVTIKRSEHELARNNAERSIQFADQAIEIAKVDGNPKKMAQAKYVLALGLMSNGKLKEAGKIFKAVIDQEEPISEVDPEIANARAKVMYGSILVQQRQFEDAIRFTREGFECYRKNRGMAFADTLMAGHNLATILGATKNDDEAIKVFNEILPARKAVLGEDHPDTLMTKTILANNLMDLKRFPEAEQLYRDALTLGDQRFQDRNPIGVLAANGLVDLRIAEEDFESAIALSKKTIQYAEAKFGAEAWQVERYRIKLAEAYLKAGEFQEAIAVSTAAYEVLSNAKGKNHRFTKSAAHTAAAAFQAIGDVDETEFWQSR